MDLLSGYGKRGVELNLLSKEVDIEDTEFLSKFFVLQEFSPQLSAGKNSITFNGSEYLENSSEILIECIDSDNNVLYIESTTKTNEAYKESSAYILSLHVYSENANGPGKLILVGKLKNGQSVRWIGNIMIDKTLQNRSSVRFYNKPVLEVNSTVFPLLSNTPGLTNTITLTGSFYSYAANPEKDNLQINKRNVDIDYRVYNKSNKLFDNQMYDSTINLYINSIQQPYSLKNLNVNLTSSYKVKKVLNNSTILLNDVIYYPDSNKNDVIVNVISGEYNITYPYISYNTSSLSSSYVTVYAGSGESIVKQCYANVIYKNLRTFSGFIARHKLYRKSLVYPGDFELIADEPLGPYEMLRDTVTVNKMFDQIGCFYNQSHIGNYWFVGGELLNITHSSDKLINGMHISCNGYQEDLNNFQNYVIVKNNISDFNRNSDYISYDSTAFLLVSGSSYDSNFIELKKGVLYVLSVNAIINKDSSTITESDSELGFYFTSSMNSIKIQQNYIEQQNGLLKIGSIPSYESIEEKVYHNPINILFTVSEDLYGTLVIIPYKCTSTISNLSIKPYGDFGYSPDILITKIPFPISTTNESFEIKAELFDVDSTLVYSDLRTITSFDPSGSSLLLYIPGLKDPTKTAYLSGSLQISQSLWINENTYITGSLTINGGVYINGIYECDYPEKRFLAYNPSDGRVCYTNLNDVDHTGTECVSLSIFDKNTPSRSIYRLIPSVEGRNVSVLKVPTQADGADIPETSNL